MFNLEVVFLSLTPERLERIIRRQRPSVEVITPSEESAVRRIPGLGHLWVAEVNPPKLHATSERGTDDWGLAFERDFVIEDDDAAIADALDWLESRPGLGRP